MDDVCCFEQSPAHNYCYKHQCDNTTLEVAKYLELKDGSYSTTFQSRVSILGNWLKPYTDKELERLAVEGKKRLVIITPAFVTDCLETLEEIAMEGKEEFLEAGGEFYHYIPCLNDGNGWAKVISNWTNKML